MPHNLIPVTVLSGFLGSGKTTLLRHILTQKGDRKIALIVNDMGEINIDAHLIKQSDIGLMHTEEKLIEMTNGCVCCTLRGDLLEAVRSIALEEKYDAIIIESTGVGEPLPIAQTFTYIDDETGIDLTQLVRLDTLVTVVDAAQFETNFSSLESLKERSWEVGQEDDRSIINLLVEQIEFADVLIINKISEVSDAQKNKIQSTVLGLNSRAKYVTTDYGIVPISSIVDTKLFDAEESGKNARWLQELESGGHHTHTPETQEYGISSFVYRRNRPFHPERLLTLAAKEWPGVIRSKGIIWIASRNNIAINWGQAGGSVTCDPAGRWLTSFDREYIEQFPEYINDYEEAREKPYGDRRQELVIITLDRNQDTIENLLDTALLNEEEMKREEEWVNMTDNWPIERK